MPINKNCCKERNGLNSEEKLDHNNKSIYPIDMLFLTTDLIGHFLRMSF